MIQPEAKPGGGIRIEAEGMTVDIDRRALERAEREGGLGFNYATTPEMHEAMHPADGFASPIGTMTNMWLQIQPGGPTDTDTDD